MYESQDQDNGFASVSIMNGSLGALTPLMQMLVSENIQPGTEPGYQLCKEILTAHPLGVVLTEEPITLAQSQPRKISVPVLGEKRIVDQYEKTWNEIGTVGATVLLHNLHALKRTYGISSLGVGEKGKDFSQPLDLSKIAGEELFFNVLDPLNTAGSLVLNQDPNSHAFLKPSGPVRVQSQVWHPSRLFTVMYGQPLYIKYTGSAFGFVGRSIFQNILFPLKSYIQTMITNDMVTKKAGLLIVKAESPSSFIDNLMQKVAAVKRGILKSGIAGQVAQIGIEEDIQTLNMQNLDGAFGMARSNVLRDIATGARMPASIITKETLAEGFGEGSEDAKEKARYIDWVREDMAPAYAFMDRIVMRKAWTVEFYNTLKATPAYADLPPFETWLLDCIRAFTAEWPNYLIEPDSEKSKNEDVKQKAAVALAEILIPECDPENKATVIMWLADNVNNLENLFTSRLVLDEDLLRAFYEKNAQQADDAAEMATEGGEDKEPKEPKPFSVAS